MNHNQLKTERAKAVSDYIVKNKLDPSPLLENTDCMTEEISELDTDDDAKKATHRKRLVQAAGLNPRDVEAEVVVWEVVRPGHRSDEVRTIKSKLCKC